MAKPPMSRGLDIASLGDVPLWGRRLVEAVSVFMQQVTDALSGNLTTENGAEAFVDVEVVGGQVAKPFTYAFRGGRKVRGVFLASAVLLPSGAMPEAAVSISWMPENVGGQPGIRLTGVSGISSGQRARLTLLLKAE